MGAHRLREYRRLFVNLSVITEIQRRPLYAAGALVAEPDRRSSLDDLRRNIRKKAEENQGRRLERRLSHQRMPILQWPNLDLRWFRAAYTSATRQPDGVVAAPNEPPRSESRRP